MTCPAPKTCAWKHCARPFVSASPQALFCSDPCRYRARDRRRKKEGLRRHNPLRTRTKPEERDMGPAHPLLLPPEVERRERARLEARILQAWRDGVSAEALAERFGATAKSVLCALRLERPKSFGLSLPLGPPL